MDHFTYMHLLKGFGIAEPSKKGDILLENMNCTAGYPGSNLDSSVLRG